MTSEKKKKIGLLLLALSATVGLAILNMSKDRDSKEEQSESNVLHEVPEGESAPVQESKSKAYTAPETQKKKSIDDYWDKCLAESQDDEKKEENAGSIHGGASSTDLFGETERQPSRQNRTYENPYRESHAEREERHRRRQEEALELAARMQEQEAFEDIPMDNRSIEIPDAEAEQSPSQVRRTSIISSLDSSWESSNIGSLEDDTDISAEDESKPFTCMFSKAVKLKNGDRVSLILLEDMVVSGILVPKYTHLMASCQISGRLELEIGNLETGGRIIPLGYEAYDIDGSKGIYCPDVGSEGRTIRNKGTNLIGSTLNSRVGRIAGDVVSTGVSLLQGRDGERTVSVPAGYTFYIIKKKDR